MNVEQSIFNKGSDRSFLRGKLIEVQKRNSNEVLKARTVREYLDINQTPHVNKYVRAFEYTQLALCGDYTDTYGNAYKLFYMDYEVIKETTTSYFDNGLTMDTQVEYKYNDDFLVSEVTTRDSSNEPFIITYKYPKDFALEQTISDPDFQYEGPVSNVYKDMADKNMLSYPIEVNKSNGSKVLSSEIISYNKLSGKINMSKYYKLENTNGEVLSFSSAVVENVNELTIDGRLTERLLYDRYDNLGNPEMYHVKGEMHTILIWGYKQSKVIAKIENVASYDDIAVIFQIYTIYQIRIMIGHLAILEKKEL
ncbi:MAG: hypothetical protein GKR88_14760 [Flavobacteriaceae bacterium]|nr:MAG: hypothetical protein GKR88_14760 [Flavobacteriaceae bacterium]